VRTPEGYWAAPWSAEEVEHLRQHYGSTPVKEIAGHLNRSYNAVVLRAKAEGLKSRHRAGVNSLVPGYFRTIDTPTKAYLLGLLTADGSVSKTGQLKLELHEKDRVLVALARDEIAPGARLSTYRTRTTPMCRFMVSSSDLVKDLARHGVVNAKSLVTTWPTELPRHLVGSYVCGYFDGDGSLSQQEGRLRWAIVSGNPVFLQRVQEQIESATGIHVGGPYQDKRHDAAWSIVKMGTSVRTLDAWIHRDVPGLARKSL
jgi:hypothetical protein